jgi:hypothetical protein
MPLPACLQKDIVKHQVSPSPWMI